MLNLLERPDTVDDVIDASLEDWKRLGAKIVERRNALGWNREQLAYEAHISIRQLSEYESPDEVWKRYPYSIRKVIYALGWSAGDDEVILSGGEPTQRLDRVTGDADTGNDLVYIMSNIHKAGPRTRKNIKAILRNDLAELGEDED